MVPPEALGKIIGPKGKTVQTMIETHGLVNINLEDTGSVQVESFSNEKNIEVMEIILKLVEESKSGGGRGDRGAGGDGREKKEKVELGPPPEVGIIYRSVMWCSYTLYPSFLLSSTVLYLYFTILSLFFSYPLLSIIHSLHSSPPLYSPLLSLLLSSSLSPLLSSSLSSLLFSSLLSSPLFSLSPLSPSLPLTPLPPHPFLMVLLPLSSLLPSSFFSVLSSSLFPYLSLPHISPLLTHLTYFLPL